MQVLFGLESSFQPHLTSFFPYQLHSSHTKSEALKLFSDSLSLCILCFPHLKCSHPCFLPPSQPSSPSQPSFLSLLQCFFLGKGFSDPQFYLNYFNNCLKKYMTPFRGLDWVCMLHALASVIICLMFIFAIRPQIP